jgi:hypothetical protein
MTTPQRSANTTTAAQPTNNSQDKPNQFAAAWKAVLTILIVAAALLLVFGATSRRIVVLVLALMIAVAALMVGALLGFLFGIPKAATSADSPKEPELEQPSSRESDSNGYKYTPNTNLEQVSDWLTKILVGVGLVEFNELRSELASMGKYVNDSITPPIAGVGVLAQVTLVSFGTIGFLASYLWTRVYFGRIQFGADHDILTLLGRLRSRVQESAEKSQKAVQLVSLVAAGELTQRVGAPESNVAAIQAPMPPDNADDTVREVFRKVADFRNAPYDWESDPVGDLFGSEPTSANGRRLTGRIDFTLDNALILALRVEKTEDGSPLTGNAIFLLHPTLPDPLRQVPCRDNAAEVKFYSEGWFHVAAIVDGGKTVLVLDLRLIPKVPAFFKNT